MNTFSRIILVAVSIVFISSCSQGTTDKKNTTTNSDSGKTAAHFDSTVVVAQHTDSIPPLWTGDYEKKWPNGVIMMKGEYKYGKRWGQWLSFYDTGKLWSEGLYKDGIRDGHSIVYYENGNKHFEGNYTNGIMTGKWKLFKEDGTLEQEKDYGK